MRPFFIAGLPRSRTAWIANFLTFGPGFCFHEPLACGLVAAIDGYPALLKDTRVDYPGVACTGNALFYGRLAELFPTARWVVVRRPLAESHEAMLRLGYDLGTTGRLLEDALIQVMDRASPLVIPYSKFNPRRIWEFCLPGVKLDPLRLELLERLKITVKEDVMQKEIDAGISNEREGLGWLKTAIP